MVTTLPVGRLRVSVAVVRVRAVAEDVTHAATPGSSGAAGPAPTGASSEVRFLSDMTVELVRHAARDEDVLFAARVSTQGEHSLAQLDADASKSRGLVNYLMRDRHGSPFEHNSMTFYVHAPIFVFREFMRHRIGYCLAGDTTLTFQSESGLLRRDTVARLYDRWHNGVQDRLPWRAGQSVRCYHEESLRPQRARIVDVLQSGVKPLLMVRTRSGRELRCTGDHAIFTPDGWAKAGDLVVGDAVMVAGDGPVKARADRVVCVEPSGEEMTYDLSVDGPWHNFVANGVIVHNSYNEESGRYRELQPVFYVPGPERKLTQIGKPGHYEFVDGTAEQAALVQAETRRVCVEAYAAYQRMLAAGVAREVARIVLPLTIYSSMYVSLNARSLMSFLSLRTKRDDSTFPSFPQREIEMCAEQMESSWAQLMPLTHAAFEANGRVSP
jgi:flavin-dependent thymidylate synthase